MAVNHVLVLLSLAAVESIVLTGKALYCRDPDTGKLHAVNSTWASSTFCGNYTCKLRRRNNTETEYTPLRQLNITSLYDENNKNLNDGTENVTVTIEDRIEPEIEPVIHKDKSVHDNLDEDGADKFDTQSGKEDVVTQMTEMMSKMAANKDDDNRYLTENEIKSISNVLQTVKRSDLDAIVDIYNLAQDIYNEMDRDTNADIINDEVNAISDDRLKHPEKSYFYDPYNAYKARFELENQGLNYPISTVPPKRNVPTYFNEVITSQDIGKLPYYYPVSAFQRSSSYLHHPTQPTKAEKPKPCKITSTKDMQGTAQTLIKPSYLLPYPFAYIHQYNYTDYPNNIFFGNSPYPWNYHNKQRQYQPYYNAYMTPVPNVPNAILINPHLREDIADIEQKPIEEKDLLGTLQLKPKENLKPEWKTDELSNQILNEVRANMDTSKLLKAFPFRNKIKLEKVGKLIKLNELTRSRRSIDKDIVKAEQVKHKKEVTEFTEDPTAEEEGEYETYLEKTMCQAKAVPGYFRYGNLTQPFPECCPQLINHR